MTSTQQSKVLRGLVVVAILAVGALCLSSTLLALVIGAVTLVAVIVDVLIHRDVPSEPPAPDVFTVDLEHRARQLRRGSQR